MRLFQFFLGDKSVTMSWKSRVGGRLLQASSTGLCVTAGEPIGAVEAGRRSRRAPELSLDEVRLF